MPKYCDTCGALSVETDPDTREDYCARHRPVYPDLEEVWLDQMITGEYYQDNPDRPGYGPNGESWNEIRALYESASIDDDEWPLE